MARVLLTRSRADCERTAAALRACGHDVMAAPLLCPEAIDWTPPADRPEALVLTSAHAAELAGPMADGFKGLPVLTVGARTASAAEAAGFQHVLRPPGVHDIHSLMAHIAGSGFNRLLHLAGRDHVDGSLPPSIQLDRRIVYGVDLAPALTAEAQAGLHQGEIDWVLLYSPRTAAHFAALCDTAGLARDSITLATISANAAQAAGQGWRNMVIAAIPTEAGLLAAAGLSCKTDDA